MNIYSKDELFNISIKTPSKQLQDIVKSNIDHIAKPLDSFGKFETILSKLGGIYDETSLDGILKGQLVIMCGDNGVVSEGVTQSDKDVTRQVALSMGRHESSVCILAREAGLDIRVIDIGIDCDEKLAGVENFKVRKGTRNLTKEAALTEAETLKALSAGIEIASQAKADGKGVLLTGEMGIGNTTTSAIIIASLLGLEAKAVTGRGAGLDSIRLLKKQEIIAQAIERLKGADALTLLGSVGGLDIAGLAGLCIGAAINQIPVILDGVIAMAAALVADRLLPGVADYTFASHIGREPAMAGAVKELKLLPVIDASMAVGEGTGAVMMYELLRMSYMVYRDAASFGRIDVDEYSRMK